MSYATQNGTVQGMGAMQDCEDFYSGGIDYCIGYERSCPSGDKCCPPDGWYNAIYADIKGDVSLRRQNEEKIRVILGLLLAPTSSNFPTGIEQYAYDKGATVPPSLMTRLQTSAQNFEELFPAARFVAKAKHRQAPRYGVQGKQCQSDGFYSGYTMRAHWPGERQAALSRVAGQLVAEADKGRLGTVGLAVSGDMIALADPKLPMAAALRPVAPTAFARDRFAQIATVINTCPGCRPDQKRDRMPTLDELLSVQNGEVRPSPWLEAFLKATSTILAGGFRLPYKPPKGAATFRLPHVPGSILDPFESASDGGVSPGGGGPTAVTPKLPSSVKIVGGLILGAAVGYGVYRVMK